MNIAFCVNHYWPSIGGAELVSQKIVEHLSKNHNVSVITRSLKSRKKIDYPIKIYEYTPGNWGGFAMHLVNSKPDLVFIYSDMFDFFRQVVMNQHKYKLVVALCGANWLFSHKNFTNILYRNLNNINHIIVHSEYDRDYKLCSSELFKRKLSIIPNGVDLQEFDQNNVTRQQLQPDLVGKRWILNVSNFFPGKGQEHIIPVLNMLAEPSKLAYIQICSDIDFPIGQQLENHWKKSCATQLNKEITYRLIKNPSREKVVGYFKQSNVFCFTSEKEVAPIVLLESMASNLPWVSTNVGNAKGLKGGRCIEAIKDSRFHNHFDLRIHKFFAQSIEELFVNPCLAEDGRMQIERELNWEKILPAYSQVVDV